MGASFLLWDRSIRAKGLLQGEMPVQRFPPKLEGGCLTE